MTENGVVGIDDRRDAAAVIAAGRRRIRGLLVAAVIALAAAAAVLVATTVGEPSTRLVEPVCLVFGPGPVNNGKAVIAAGVAMDVPDEGIVAGLTAAMAETHLLNLANPHVPDSLAVTHDGLAGDRQSVGILQQGAGWGTAEERMSPAASAARFYVAMFSLDGWETMTAAEMAGLVQRSAWPDGYIDDEPAARRFYRDHIDEVRASRCAAGPADAGAVVVGAPS